jgi:hypothetical protein
MRASAFLFSASLYAFAACPAYADTYMYPATCEKSYVKQGEEDEDLSTKKGQPLKCDGLLLSMLKNGRILIQFTDTTSNLSPFGFGASQIDRDSNPNFITVPLERFYVPHAGDAAKPVVRDAVEGFCFFDDKNDITALTRLACAAMLSEDSKKTVYHIELKVTGERQTVPGL